MDDKKVPLDKYHRILEIMMHIFIVVALLGIMLKVLVF